MIYRINKFDYINLRNINYITNTDEQKVDPHDGKLRVRVYVNFVCGGGASFYLTQQELQDFQKVLENYGIS